MQSAMGLATIFGPFLVILGLWMLLYNENMNKVWTSIKNTPGVFYLGGIINLLVGLTILSQYNVWEWNLGFLVTLLGWLLVIRGILVFFIPQLVIKSTMGNATFLKFMGLIPLVWGILLCWYAFFM